MELPESEVLATTPTELTVPVTAASTPEVVTVKVPLLISVMVPDEESEDDVVPVEVEPDPLELSDPPADPPPELAELPEVSPLEMPTAATTPAKGAVRVAPARLLFASVTALSLTVTAALAAEISVLVDEESSSTLSRESSAAARSAWAVWSATLSEEGSMEASAWPFVTVDPTLTLTLVTVPEESKDRLSCCSGARVPEAETVDFRVCAETVEVRYWVPPGPSDLLARPRMNHTARAMTTATAISMVICQRRRRGHRCEKEPPDTSAAATGHGSRHASHPLSSRVIDRIRLSSALSELP